MHGVDAAVGKCRGVECRGGFGGAVIPQADDCFADDVLLSREI